MSILQASTKTDGKGGFESAITECMEEDIHNGDGSKALEKRISVQRYLWSAISDDFKRINVYISERNGA
jgi:hypothetical protein